jgi:hypothetical protein
MGVAYFKSMIGDQILTMNLFKKSQLRKEKVKKSKKSFMEKKVSQFLSLEWININVRLKQS